MGRETKTIAPRPQTVRQAVKPMRLDSTRTIPEFLTSCRELSSQARQLGNAFDLWQKIMAEPRCVVTFGLGSALVHSGLREILVHQIRNRYVDVIVSSGAALYQDLYETLGLPHYQSEPIADDQRCRELDGVLVKFARKLERRPWSTREFFHAIGAHLQKIGRHEGLLTAAARHGVPVYCPSVVDSGLGLAFIHQLQGEKHPRFTWDMIRDTDERVGMATGEKYVLAEVLTDAGASRNFLQQAGPQGVKFSITLSTEGRARAGELNGDASRCVVQCDPTITLPLLVSGLHQNSAAARRSFVPFFAYDPKLTVSFVKRGGTNNDRHADHR